MPWLDRVSALVEAWYPGQEDGNAVANVLFGFRNPSGKLPMTFGAPRARRRTRRRNSSPASGGLRGRGSRIPIRSPHYTEDLQMGYRWYEANRVTPVFPFGFGLSYTTFAYSGLAVTPAVEPKTGARRVEGQLQDHQHGQCAGCRGVAGLSHVPAGGRSAIQAAGRFREGQPDARRESAGTVIIDSSAPNHPLSYWVPQNDAPGRGLVRASGSHRQGTTPSTSAPPRRTRRSARRRCSRPARRDHPPLARLRARRCSPDRPGCASTAAGCRRAIRVSMHRSHRRPGPAPLAVRP